VVLVADVPLLVEPVGVVSVDPPHPTSARTARESEREESVSSLVMIQGPQQDVSQDRSTLVHPRNTG
jgi:hypothetical protein